MKDNFKIKYGLDLNYPFCRKEAETLQHILQCDCVSFVKQKNRYISKSSFTGEA